MIRVTKVVLDVLKPHQPNSLEFAKAIAAVEKDCSVYLDVQEMDEKTETVKLEICAHDIDIEVFQAAITRLGASLHSIDVVKVKHDSEEAAAE